MSNTELSALEPVVGVYGLRTFRVSLDGKLLPIGQLSDDWDGGRCIARCAIGGDHTAPETDCTCGIYSFRDRVHLAKHFSAAHSLIAVVALEGTTVEGDRGWRSQAAQVVAVWIADDALPSSLRAALLAGLPNVREYTSPTEMIANFPSLTCSEGYPPAESLPRRQSPRRASTSIPGEFRRWNLALAANFLFSVGIKTSVLILLLQTWQPADAAGNRGILQSWLTANHDLLVYLALNPGVLIAFFVTTTVVGAVFAIGQARKRSWLGRVTWRAGTLALAMLLAATFADLNPPWVTWCGFLAVNVLLYLATQPVSPSWSSVVPTGQAAGGGGLSPRRGTSEQGLRVHEIIEPVTFTSPTHP